MAENSHRLLRFEEIEGRFPAAMDPRRELDAKRPPEQSLRKIVCVLNHKLDSS